MSNLQAPANEQNQSTTERMIQFGLNVIEPHATIVDVSVRKRAQLLNAITLILTLSSIIGLIAQPASDATFEIVLFISVCSFLLGKSKYPSIGTFFFSFGFLSTTYISLYFGFANDYSMSVLSIVPIALIAASALTSQRTFAGLALYAAIAAFLTPQYLITAGAADETARVVGIVTSIGAVLYGISAFRLNIENSRLLEARAANQELQNLKVDIEERAQKHTQEINTANQQIQERVARLRVMSDLSQAISASVNKDQKELLTYITQIISQELGFYHVGIFLLDKNRQYAELRAANSKGGQRMLNRRHQLKVGGAGIVGYVAQSGYPRIALSTGTDAVFFNNPDLPDTQSEMALPLKIGNQVIGVLDVQSPLPAAFTEEDINTFTALSNQIAFVIQTTQIDERTSGLSIQNAKKTGELQTRKGKEGGYVYLADGTISSAQVISNPVLDKAIASGEVVALPASSKNALPILAVPVKIRDHVIGYIHIEAAESNRKWTEDEIAMVASVSERAALALENARLFEKTERRAEQEQIMARMTSRIGESTSFDRVLQTTIQEIGRTLGAKRTFIQLEAPSTSEDDAATDQGI
jgi:GAF domain-containing protein